MQSVQEYDNWGSDALSLIHHVIEFFNNRYPQWMDKVINPYLENMNRQQEQYQFNYSLLDGETQQGKTLVMHLLAWILSYQYGYVPCYITKKLDSLREDAIDKMNDGAVNKIVDDVASDLGLSSIAKNFHLQACVGLRHTNFHRGVIPIFLIEPSNNVKVLRWIKELSKMVGYPRYPVFIFDEVQELYTKDSVAFLLTNNHLSKEFLEKDKICGHFLIHKVVDLCKKKACAMIGITATPQRVLASDPEACPTHIYKIPCVAPIPGLKRIGYIDGSDEFQGATFNAETDSVEIVRKILDGVPATMSDGKKQVRFLNITIKRDNADMRAIHDAIMDSFPTLAYVKTFMQDSKEYRNINIRVLDHFFDLRHVTEKIITNGLMILIGKSREGAGITIKPSFKLTSGCKHHIRKIGNDTWTINGITDMQFCLGKNMEFSEQLFGRGSGWVDPNHNFSFWLPKEDIHDVRHGIIRSKRDMITKYKEGLLRGEIGPSSILNVINMCTKSKLYDPNDLYIRNSNSNMGHITIGSVTDLPAINVTMLDTTIHKISDLNYQAFMQAKPNGGNSTEARKVRSAIIKELSDQAVLIRENFFQIPWSETRNDQILKASAQPRKESQWKVNSYCVIGENTMSVVVFNNEHDNRLCFPHAQCPECDVHQCTKHVNLNDTIYWKETDDLYRYATFNSDMCHRYSTSIQNWILDRITQQHILDRIDQLVDLCIDSIRKKNPYNLFQNLHTIGGFNSKRPVDVHHSRWIAGLWKTFQSNFKELYVEMSNRVHKANPGEESQLLPDLEELLEPYFKKQFHKEPIVKIRAVIRARPLPIPDFSPVLSSSLLVSVPLQPVLGSPPITKIKVTFKKKH